MAYNFNDPTKPTPDLDLADLQKQSQDASDKKAMYQILGGAFQNAASTPTAYELLKGGRSTAPDLKSGFDAAANAVQDPWEKQKKTYEMFKAAADNQNAQRDQGYQTALADGDSVQSKAIKAVGIKNGIFSAQDAANMSGYDAAKLVDPKALGEIKAKAAVEMGNKMKEMQFGNQLEMGKMGYQKAITPATPEEFKSAGAGQIGQNANDQLTNLSKDGYKNTGPEAFWNNMHIPKPWGEGDMVSMPNSLKTAQGTNFDDAKDGFLDALVSHRTAKGMNPERRETLEKTYIPQPGDTDDAIKQKAERRDQALSEMRSMAGPKAWAQVNTNAGTQIAGPALPPGMMRIPGVTDFGPVQGAGAGPMDPNIVKMARQNGVPYDVAAGIVAKRKMKNANQ